MAQENQNKGFGVAYSKCELQIDYLGITLNMLFMSENSPMWLNENKFCKEVQDKILIASYCK